MNDLLLSAAKNPFLKNILSSAGLPTPVSLKRQEGALSAIPLKDQRLAFFSLDPKTPEALLAALSEKGANVLSDLSVSKELQSKIVACGRRIARLDSLGDTDKLDALVFDGSKIQSVTDLESLYHFFHANLARVAANGRIVIVGRALALDTTYACALEGFTRSIAKETGARGITANLLLHSEHAEDFLIEPLTFFLSKASCYVTGQILTLNNDAVKPKSIPQTQSLAGKVALVTGAARGIGAKIAAALAAEGAHVVCLDRAQEAEALAATARKLDGHIFHQDLSEKNAAEKIAIYFKTKFQGCDIVVHNAGITLDKTIKKMPVESWQRVMDINLRAPMEITQRMLKENALKSEAHIVCLSSIAGIAGNFGQTNYSASKAALRGFVAAMAGPMAEIHGTINAVAPGFIETRMTESIPLLTREVGRRLNSLGQGGRPEDVAQVVSFLAQPASFAVSGQTIRICGGSLLGA